MHCVSVVGGIWKISVTETEVRIRETSKINQLNPMLSIFKCRCTCESSFRGIFGSTLNRCINAGCLRQYFVSFIRVHHNKHRQLGNEIIGANEDEQLKNVVTQQPRIVR